MQRLRAPPQQGLCARGCAASASRAVMIGRWSVRSRRSRPRRPWLTARRLALALLILTATLAAAVIRSALVPEAARGARPVRRCSWSVAARSRRTHAAPTRRGSSARDRPSSPRSRRPLARIADGCRPHGLFACAVTAMARRAAAGRAAAALPAFVFATATACRHRGAAASTSTARLLTPVGAARRSAAHRGAERPPGRPRLQPARALCPAVTAASGPPACRPCSSGQHRPNLTYVGSLATLLWRRVLHAEDTDVELWEFLRARRGHRARGARDGDGSPMVRPAGRGLMRALVWIVEDTWEATVAEAAALLHADAEITLLHVAASEAEHVAEGARRGLLGRPRAPHEPMRSISDTAARSCSQTPRLGSGGPPPAASATAAPSARW